MNLARRYRNWKKILRVVWDSARAAYCRARGKQFVMTHVVHHAPLFECGEDAPSAAPTLVMSAPTYGISGELRSDIALEQFFQQNSRRKATIYPAFKGEGRFKGGEEMVTLSHYVVHCNNPAVSWPAWDHVFVFNRDSKKQALKDARAFVKSGKAPAGVPNAPRNPSDDARSRREMGIL